MARTKTPKKRNPVIVTDEMAEELVQTKEIAKAPKAGVHLTKIGKADREYLRGMLGVFIDMIEPMIMEGPAQGNFRYSPRQMWDNTRKYFQVSVEYGQPLTVSGIAAFNGMLTSDLLRDYRSNGREEYKFLSHCVRFVEMYNEYAVHKKQNPAGPIFILKNFGWKDKVEVEHNLAPGAMTPLEREEAQSRLKGFSEEVIHEADVV